MPRFHFNFASAQRFVYDDQGAELPSLRSAHMRAVWLIARTARLMDPADKERWTVQIADERGALLLTVMFPSLRPAGFGRGQASSETMSNRPTAKNTPAILKAYAAALRDIRVRPNAGPEG